MEFLAILFFLVVIWIIKQAVSGGGGSGGGSNGSYTSNTPYKRMYNATKNATKLPDPKTATGVAQGVPNCKFLLTAKQHLARDYVLIIDRSGSMGGKRWQEAEKAVSSLAPYICKFDPDGVDVILFDHKVEKVENVQTAKEVAGIFSSYKPRGSTNLSLALHTAFEAHFAGTRGATTILVVTDGSPDSQGEVQRVIRRATHSMVNDEELSVSFIQIGTDRSATKFLEYLDDDLTDVQFDIVDTVSAQVASGISFPELIARSIYD